MAIEKGKLAGWIFGKTGAGRAGRVTTLAVMAALIAHNSENIEGPTTPLSPSPEPSTMAAASDGRHGFLDSGTELFNRAGSDFCGPADAKQKVLIVERLTVDGERWVRIASTSGELAIRNVPLVPDCQAQPWTDAAHVSATP